MLGSECGAMSGEECGAMSCWHVLNKNGPLTTEIAILNLENGPLKF